MSNSLVGQAHKHALDLERLRASIAAELPPGMQLGKIEILPTLDRKANVTHVVFAIEIPAARQTALQDRMAWLISQTALPIRRERGPRRDARSPCILSDPRS